MLNEPALTFNAYHLGGPGQGSREELDDHSQRRSGPEKSGALIHVRSGDMVVEALRQMRDNRVRSVLVIDDDVLVGIVTQGDCAIKVLLPGLDEANFGGPSDDGRPGDGQAGRPLEGCMAMMSARGFAISQCWTRARSWA